MSETAIALATLIRPLAAVVLACALFLVGARRIVTGLRLYALQSWALGAIAAAVAFTTGHHHLYVAAALAALVKGITIPLVMAYAVRRVAVRKEIEPVFGMGPALSLLVCAGLIAAANFVAGWLFALTSEAPYQRIALTASIATMLIGLFVMMTRRQAVTQIIGFNLMENGIFLGAFTLTAGMPLIVEMGIFFDLLVGAMVTGLLLHRIDRTFDSIDVDRLSQLRG